MANFPPNAEAKLNNLANHFTGRNWFANDHTGSGTGSFHIAGYNSGALSAIQWYTFDWVPYATLVCDADGGGGMIWNSPDAISINSLVITLGAFTVNVTSDLNVANDFALTGTMTLGNVPAARLTSGTIAVARSWAYTGGDVTGSAGSAVLTIGAGKVTLAMQANMATASVVYRKTAGSGAPEVQTIATLKTDLGLTGTNSGDQTITLTGGVTGSGTSSFAATVVTNANLTGNVTSVGNATTITAAAVTRAMLANSNALSVIGRSANSAGVPADIAATALTRAVLAESGASTLAFSSDYVCVLDRVVATTTIANTTTLTDIYTKTISHDDINGHALRLVIGGTYTNNTGAGATLNVRVLFGGTTYYRDTSLSLGTSASSRAWRMELMLTSRSTTAQSAIGTIAMSDSAGPPSGVGPISVAQAFSAAIQFDGTETTSGAGTKALTIRTAHSAASASLSVSLTSAVLERL